MRPHPLCILLAVTMVVGCREPPTPPSQKAVDRSWKRTEQAVRKAAEAEQQVRQARRLRDIDRMRYQSEALESKEQATVLRGWLIGLTLVLLAVMLWLGIEIRRRRTLGTVLRHTLKPPPRR